MFIFVSYKYFKNYLFSGKKNKKTPTCQIPACRSATSLSQSLSSALLLRLSAGLNEGSHIHLLHEAHFLIRTSLLELEVFPRDKVELLTHAKCSQRTHQIQTKMQILSPLHIPSGYPSTLSMSIHWFRAFRLSLIYI